MIIDGVALANTLTQSLTSRIARFKKPLRLAAVLVSDDAIGSPSAKFLQLKKKAAEKIGIEFVLHHFPSAISTEELREKVVEIDRAVDVDGVVVQLPLPFHIETQSILDMISSLHDVDVLSSYAQGTYIVGRSHILPPAVSAVKHIFESVDYSLRGKVCAVFGYGTLVGRPIAHWLAQQSATVNIINEYTRNPEQCSLIADVIVSGTGVPHLIRGDMVRQGAFVIDFGYSKKDGIISGDVDFEGAASKTSYITPVPGGVGPLVIASLLENLVLLTELSHHE
jgi:methylenetetrahydrofolate dehydrogenase (NADP+)/methenyltetrahydrofolate cyclohydrolase